jgi:hypothetical protein
MSETVTLAAYLSIVDNQIGSLWSHGFIVNQKSPPLGW